MDTFLQANDTKGFGLSVLGATRIDRFCSQSSDDHEIASWEWTKKKPADGLELPADITGTKLPADITGTELQADITGTELPAVITGTELPADITGTELPADITGTELPADITGTELSRLRL